MEDNRITAVLGIYNSLERTKKFLEDFKTRFPAIPLSVSTVGSSQEVQDELEKLYPGEIVTGTTERVSYSTTWNAAIKNVKTERFVFLHNDMYIHDSFFSVLDRAVKDPNIFYLYTTVEPFKNEGFPRTGKIIARWGEDLDSFNLEAFNSFVAKKLSNPKVVEKRGLGIYLAGFTKSIFDVGGFDQDTFNKAFCEDDDLQLRALLKGYNFQTCTNAVVYHFASKTSREVKDLDGADWEMNIKFAKKWGIEARYVDASGIVNAPESERSVGKETIGLRLNSLTPDLESSLFGLGILVSKIEFRNPEHQKYLEEHYPDCCGSVDSCDIVLTEQGDTSFSEIAFLIGDLKVNHKHLKPGHIDASRFRGNLGITVNRVCPDVCVEDTKNYLFLYETE